MAAQYGFNCRDELYMVSFIPETEDRERLPVATMNELGAPDGMGLSWIVGDVELEVKVAGVLATMTHRKLADR